MAIVLYLVYYRGIPKVAFPSKRQAERFIEVLTGQPYDIAMEDVLIRCIPVDQGDKLRIAFPPRYHSGLRPSSPPPFAVPSVGHGMTFPAFPATFPVNTERNDALDAYRTGLGIPTYQWGSAH